MMEGEKAKRGFFFSLRHKSNCVVFGAAVGSSTARRERKVTTRVAVRQTSALLHPFVWLAGCVRECMHVYVLACLWLTCTPLYPGGCHTPMQARDIGEASAAAAAVAATATRSTSSRSSRNAAPLAMRRTASPSLARPRHYAQHAHTHTHTHTRTRSSEQRQ